MTPKKFIINELKCFIKQFPSARVRYEFHELANAHFIEVVPLETYLSNEAYIAWESAMWDRFVELYPEEGICFISTDALVGIQNAELTLCGKDYRQFSTIGKPIDVDSLLLCYRNSKQIVDVTFTEAKHNNINIDIIEDKRAYCGSSANSYLFAA
jgi:hypothetical protein